MEFFHVHANVLQERVLVKEHVLILEKEHVLILVKEHVLL